MSENTYKNVLLSIVYDNKTLTKINSGMDRKLFLYMMIVFEDSINQFRAVVHKIYICKVSKITKQ